MSTFESSPPRGDADGLTPWSPPKRPDVLWNYCTTRGDEALAEAARRLRVSIVGERADGFGGKSSGAIVSLSDGRQRWLKVSGLIGTSVDRRREGEMAAGNLFGVTKPTIMQSIEWTEDNVYWRAMLMTLAPSPVAERWPWRRPGTAPPPDAWFNNLRSALVALQQARTRRRVFTQEQIRYLVACHFGADAPATVRHWCVSHGDLQWSNVTVPRLNLLDWEHWGLAPCGYDAARLLAYSAYDPATARKIRTVFADQLDTPSGRVALLTAIALIKTDITSGHADPGLSGPLDRMSQAAFANETDRFLG